MKQLLLIITLFFSMQGFAQGRNQLAGTWLAKKTDSTSKDRMEIEFQFKKNGDYIVIRSRGRLKANNSKSTVNIFETQSVFSFQTLDKGQIYRYSYHYSFQSDDVLILTRQDDPSNVTTFERKKT